ncbi:hypothetical protein CUR95_23960 [Bordetella bronchiseptica]|nr:hypothetical protein [Bordetella bronchiseptica]
MEMSSLFRQLGLAARGAVHGAAALPSMLWNGPVDAINQSAGTNIPRADIDPALDALGLPQPANATERVAQDAVGAMSGGGAALSLARRGAELAADPTARAMAALFAEAPLAQLASAGLSAGASGAAREGGAGEGEQTLIGILAGLAPAAPSALAARGAFSSKLAQTGEGPWGPVYGNLAGDPENAVAHLLRMKSGEVPGALTHPDVPGNDITLNYGSYAPDTHKGSGVAKLANKHAETLQDLQGFLDSMHKNPDISGQGRIRMTDDGQRRGVVSLNRFDEPADPWLLTAYERQSPAQGGALASDTTMDTIGLSRRGDTARPAGHTSIDEFLDRNPGARDPRQYVGILPPDEAAARRQMLEQRLRAALFGTAIGTGTEGP